MPAISDQDMNAMLNEESRVSYLQKFSKVSLSNFENLTFENQKFHFRRSKISLSKIKNFIFEIRKFLFRNSDISLSKVENCTFKKRNFTFEIKKFYS